MTTTKASEVTAEAIEAARPAISWIRPGLLASFGRYLLRRGWRPAFTDPVADAQTTRSAGPLLILFLSPPNETALHPATTFARFWASGMLVVEGPEKDAKMAAIAALRVSGDAAREDDHGGYRTQRILRAHGPSPAWLLE